MRSRYAAYALGLVEYIIDTTLVGGSAYEQNTKRWAASVRSFCRATRFEGLKIMTVRTEDTKAWVTFVASLRQHGQRQTLVEESYFVRLQRRWFYEGGQTAPAQAWSTN